MKWVKEVKRYKLPGYKIHHRDIRYSMATIVNNIVLCIQKLLKVDLKSPPHKKKICNCVMMDVNKVYCGDHFAIYTSIDSCCTPETNVICQLYLKKNTSPVGRNMHTM